jgi:hypothetical protein
MSHRILAMWNPLEPPSESISLVTGGVVLTGNTYGEDFFGEKDVAIVIASLTQHYPLEPSCLNTHTEKCVPPTACGKQCTTPPTATGNHEPNGYDVLWRCLPTSQEWIVDLLKFIFDAQYILYLQYSIFYHTTIYCFVSQLTLSYKKFMFDGQYILYLQHSIFYLTTIYCFAIQFN